MISMVILDLLVGEKEKFLKILSRYPNLFITSYEEIIGFKGVVLHIEVKDGVKPMHQRLRRMG